MTYTKPTVVELKAVEAILGSSNKPQFVFQLDADNIHNNATVAAYEADE